MRPALVGSLIAATLLTAACHSRRPVTFDELGGLRPARVWVTRGDQSVVIVSGPQVLDNKLVGWVDGKYREMPVADLKQVVMESRAPGRTAVLVTAGAIGVAAVVFMLTGTGNSENPCDLGSSECEPT